MVSRRTCRTSRATASIPIRSTRTKRLFVATEQTLALRYAKFNPGFFDLIIFDEAHRSLFKRFTEVIEYFDARMIGLTATPANFIDRDTFRLFACDANAPTFLYDYPQAVNDGFLVDFSLYQAHTSFQRKASRRRPQRRRPQRSDRARHRPRQP